MATRTATKSSKTVPKPSKEKTKTNGEIAVANPSLSDIAPPNENLIHAQNKIATETANFDAPTKRKPAISQETKKVVRVTKTVTKDISDAAKRTSLLPRVGEIKFLPVPKIPARKPSYARVVCRSVTKETQDFKSLGFTAVGPTNFIATVRFLCFVLTKPDEDVRKNPRIALARAHGVPIFNFKFTSYLLESPDGIELLKQVKNLFKSSKKDPNTAQQSRSLHLDQARAEARELLLQAAEKRKEVVVSHLGLRYLPLAGKHVIILWNTKDKDYKPLELRELAVALGATDCSIYTPPIRTLRTLAQTVHRTGPENVFLVVADPVAFATKGVAENIVLPYKLVGDFVAMSYPPPN